MKVLWITGALLPEATAKIRGEREQQWNTTGSWILGAAAALVKMEYVRLYMAATSQDVKKLTRVEAGGVVSFAIPYGKGPFKENRAYGRHIKAIHDEVAPDIVHIHGTEYTHGLAYIRVCGTQHVVISIQGMTSVIYRYFQAGMSNREVLKNTSLRDLIRGGIFYEKHSFRKRGKLEKEMIRSVGHVIGRTSWDYAHTKAINSNVVYHHVDETLRDEFYFGNRWTYSRCTPHTIVAICGYPSPFKGLHQLLKALPLVLRKYPDAQLRVCGDDPTLGYQASQWWRITGYGRYVKSLIRKMGLKGNLTFLGQKDACGIKEELLHCNVFVCPSAIENSSNSLGEAQILGVPCVAAYVGGVIDMMTGNEANLYRFEEVEMLADKVCQVFAKKNHQVDMSETAAKRHDKNKNVEELMTTYLDILAD